MVENFKEIMTAAKDACNEMDCAECPFATGVFMPAGAIYYYFCSLRKKPRDWDLSSDKVKLVKNGEPAKEEKEKKTTKRKTTKKTTASKKKEK